MQNIIFDLDGTLWDSREQIIKAWSTVLSKNLNKNIDIKKLTKLMGKTSNEFKSELFGDIPSDLADKYLKLCEEAEIDYLSINGATIYSNSIDTIKSLAKMYKLFIVSNCQSGYIESFLKYYNLEKYFTDIECNGNTGLSKSKNIELIINRNKLSNNTTCYIGDTSDDSIAAKENNILFIFASYGFGSVNDQEYSINDISEIQNIIKSIN